MTMLPAAVAEALAEPGCFVDSHRTPDGVWLHRAVYTGPDAAPAAELGAAGPDGTWQRLRRQPGEGDADLLELAVKHLRGCGFDQRADAVQALADSYADAVDTARRALALLEAYRVALEAIVRDCGTLADAKGTALGALR